MTRRARLYSVFTMVFTCWMVFAFSSVLAGGNKKGVDAETRRTPPTPIEGPEYEALKILSQYLADAALRNPRLKSAFHRWKAALQKIPQVKALPDPRFNFAYYIQSVETRVGPQEARLALSQTFPWFGTLDLKKDVATQEANAVKAEYDSLKLKLFYQVKNAFYEYAYLAQAIQITKQNIALLEFLNRVAMARYSSGATPYADVLKTQVQLGQLEDRLKSLEDLRKPLSARLAATMDRPVEPVLPWPPAVPVMLISMTEEALYQELPDKNPTLRRYEYLTAKDRSGIDLARKGYYPSVTFGLENIVTGSAVDPAAPDSGQDAVIASVTVDIPLWWEKRHAAVREKEENLSANQREADAAKRDLEVDAAVALYKYRDAQRKIDLYRDTLLPKAEEAFGVALEAFQAGARSSLDLIDAEKTLLEIELAYLRALADQAQRLAELELLLGREIPCQIHGALLPGHERLSSTNSDHRDE